MKGKERKTKKAQRGELTLHRAKKKAKKSTLSGCISNFCSPKQVKQRTRIDQPYDSAPSVRVPVVVLRAHVLIMSESIQLLNHSRIKIWLLRLTDITMMCWDIGRNGCVVEPRIKGIPDIKITHGTFKQYTLLMSQYQTLDDLFGLHRGWSVFKSLRSYCTQIKKYWNCMINHYNKIVENSKRRNKRTNRRNYPK